MLRNTEGSPEFYTGALYSRGSEVSEWAQPGVYLEENSMNQICTNEENDQAAQLNK